MLGQSVIISYKRNEAKRNTPKRYAKLHTLFPRNDNSFAAFIKEYEN